MKQRILLSVFLLFFSVYSSALTIKLNSTKENRSFIYILHITDKKPFSCKKKSISIDRNEYICKVKGKNEVDISPKKTKFLELYVKNQNKFTLIVIKPKENVKVFTSNTPLYKRKIISNETVKYARHWIFLLYKDKLFLKSSGEQNGINFPVDFLKELTPSIGALDLSGAPVSYLNDSKDINDYLSIKNDYDRKRYDFVILEAKKALKNYPNSIFLNDFMLYYIRAIYKTLQTKKESPNAQDLSYDEIIKLGKKWIKKFPSNQNIPEVLYYIASSYQNLGQNSDAKYFFDILITEHPKNKYTKLGIITFADSLYAKNQKQKAIKLYKDVLYSTKDIDVASIAAKKLADIYIKTKQYKKARVYFEKIISANADFLLSNHQKAYDLAISLSANGINDIAAQILEKLLKKLKREPDLKESVLKSLGDIYAKNKQYKKASFYYKKYLSLYKYGNYTEEVKKSLDGMFFNINENNTTKLIKYYDKLISKYKTGPIYEKAAILKAKALMKEKKYKEALLVLNNLETNFKNKKRVGKLKKEIALLLATDSLKKEDCIEAIGYVNDYNLTITSHQKELANCYIQTYNYKKAISLSEKIMKSKNLSTKEKLAWLDIEAKSLLKTHSYKKLSLIADDIITLSKAFKMDSYSYKGLYYKFFALYGLKKYDLAMQSAQEIDKNFSDNFKNIEIYKKVVDLAKQRADDLMIAKYAKKILNLQEKYKSYPLSPQIEFEYVTSLKRLNKDEEAVGILRKLSVRENSPSVFSRIYYEIGAIYLKKGDKTSAKNAFEKCLKAKGKNSWKTLCKENLSLL